MQITIEQETMLDSIPSGSGIVLYEDHLYIVGDDAPFVYKYSIGDHKVTKIRINGLSDSSFKIPKPVKPDLEAALVLRLNDQDHLLAFGSGSMSPTRDSMLLLNLANPAEQRMLPMGEAYEKMRKETSAPAGQWNIEGATLITDHLLLLNRANNHIISVRPEEFVDFVNGKKPFPSVTYNPIKLPIIKGHEARFSGACSLNDNKLLIFCASVEDTPDWTTDGPVLGSFIGLLDLDQQGQKQLRKVEQVKQKNGQPFTEKIESIDVWKKQANGEYIAFGITDNDQGGSKLLEIRIRK
jgi:hypothetical protein